ncbi:MAG: glycosyltransferase family 39 protein [Deltaproteobacteria bacterium]|nr:glycosyltransferase family 39 protein [Deltaproteobacteria bacterium]
MSMTACEEALHLVPALLGVAFIAASWFVALRLGGRDAAAWTIAVVVGTTPLVRFDVELMSDLPSTACMLAIVAVLVRELRDRPSWRITVCAPLAIAAVYIRYGSCLPVALIGAAAFAFGARAIVRRPGPPLVTAGLVAAAIVPLRATLAYSARVPPATPGLVHYVTRAYWYFGALAPPLMMLALIARDRWRRFAVVIGVADIVALGIETAAQTRYVVLGLVLLVAVGVAEARDRIMRSRHRRMLGIAAGVAVGTMWLVALAAAYTARERRHAGMAPTLAAAAAIRHDAHGEPCDVIGRHFTQLEWYSGCRAVHAATPGIRTYVVRDDTGGPGQPEPVTGIPILATSHVQVTRVP